MSHSGTTSLASLDGEIMLAAEATIPATDDGLIRGDGAFEVIRIYDGTPFKLDAHLARLQRSGAGLRLPIDLEVVRAEVYRLLARACDNPAVPEDHALLRVIVTRGGRRLLLTERMPDVPERPRLMPVTYAPTRILDGLKSLSYAANMLASRLAQEAGFDEALLVTPHGRVLEAPTASVFWATDGELFTPPLDEHILASITRALVLEVTDAQERPVTLEQLLAADEVFLASTTREVLPVAAIDEQTFATPGPVSERAATAVSERIRQELAAS